MGVWKDGRMGYKGGWADGWIEAIPVERKMVGWSISGCMDWRMGL